MSRLRPARWAAGALVLTLAACGSSLTGPPITDINQAKASWDSHNLTRYAYQYRTSGFFNSFDGRTIRLVVLNDTVRSAQFVDTNDTIPMASTLFPSIDGLFAQAIAAHDANTLLDARFDSALGFPSLLKFGGLPDVSGTITASSVELLP